MVGGLEARNQSGAQTLRFAGYKKMLQLDTYVSGFELRFLGVATLNKKQIEILEFCLVLTSRQ